MDDSRDGQVDPGRSTEEDQEYVFDPWASRAIPGLVAIPSPVISRTRPSMKRQEDPDACWRANPTPAQIPDVVLHSLGKPPVKDLAFHLLGSLKDARKSCPSSDWHLHEGLYKGFEALLKATAATAPRLERGVGSLFSMCLRRVPGYVEDEQRRQQEEAEADRARSYLEAEPGVASAVYEELEELGSSQRGGWKHLGEVGRAHGTSIMANLTRSGLVRQSLTRAAVLLSISLGAHDEAEILVSALTSACPPLHYPRSPSHRLFAAPNSTVMSVLDTFASITGRQGFLYRQFTFLVSSQKLPIEWLATIDVVDLWKRAIESVLVEEADSVWASEFITTALTATHGLLDGSRIDELGCLPQDRDEVFRKRMSCREGVGTAHHTELARPAQALVDLTISTARCRCKAKGGVGDGFEEMKALVDDLADLAGQHCTRTWMSREERRELGEIGYQAALSYAEETGRPEHLRWARSAVTTSFDGAPREASKDRGPERPRFRWEDGLCEWIAVTPEVHHKTRRLPNSSSLDQTDDLHVLGDRDIVERAVNNEPKTPKLSRMLFGPRPDRRTMSEASSSVAASSPAPTGPPRGRMRASSGDDDRENGKPRLDKPRQRRSRLDIYDSNGARSAIPSRPAADDVGTTAPLKVPDPSRKRTMEAVSSQDVDEAGLLPQWQPAEHTGQRPKRRRLFSTQARPYAAGSKTEGASAFVLSDSEESATADPAQEPRECKRTSSPKEVGRTTKHTAVAAAKAELSLGGVTLRQALQDLGNTRQPKPKQQTAHDGGGKRKQATDEGENDADGACDRRVKARAVGPVQLGTCATKTAAAAAASPFIVDDSEDELCLL
ncbi:MAG: hypothetical protein M1832_003182 [Thelocarpon impressellum]|nr:MAG: hypothetical protein M1832_003182 [Thelocarpon impressellum]